MTPLSLIAIESIKTTRAVSFWISLGIFALFSFFILWFNFHGTTVVNGQEVSNMLLPRDWERLLSQFKGLQIIFVPISLILLTASEFTFKTARQNVIDGLSKESFLISKLLTTLALTLLYILLPLLLGALFNLSATNTEPTETARALITSHELFLFGTYLLALLGYGFLGLFFAFLTRSTGSAIALYVLYLVLEGLAGGLLQFSSTLKSIVKFFPTKVFDELVNSFRFDSESLAELQSQIKRAEEMGQTIPDAVYAQLPQFETEVMLLLALLYIGLIGGATYILFKQRDL